MSQFLEGGTGMLAAPMPSLNDPEGDRVLDSLPPVIDAHVHVFPDSLFEAIRRWFDRHAWPIRYRLSAPQVIEFLFARGIRHIVALHYAHKPGISRDLNAFAAALVNEYLGVTALATVFPGEPDDLAILEEAFGMGLRGVKLHSHVQCFEFETPTMHRIYDLCSFHGKPMVIHAGREPKSPAYGCDPYILCGADRIRRILRSHPDLRLCIPHLGFDEFGAYDAMVQEFDTLWLDTTMTLGGYFMKDPPLDLAKLRSDRILYGTDFPNIPYAWDRELKQLQRLDLPPQTLERILWRNAVDLFSIDMDTCLRPDAKETLV